MLKKLYWSSTILLCAMMLLTGIFYFVFYDKLVVYFNSYDYPIYLIYPLAVLKILGALTILYHKQQFLRELAYAGFLYNFILAFFAHIMIGEMDPFPTISLLLLGVSYFTGKKIRP